ncbi:MAG: hypothetical protein Q7T76_20880 [Ferruginibacter sp.]|nr:hypothetical protein [Ferruginibacter sp.]
MNHSERRRSSLEMTQFYKMLLSPTMSLEEKMDELWDLPTEDLDNLMEDFEAEENFEACQAIKAVLDERTKDN